MRDEQRYRPEAEDRAMADGVALSKRSEKFKTFAMLHAILLLYSLGGVCSKMASGCEFMSPAFILWYGAMFVELVIYAFIWQKVLKRLPLTTAYSNKGITIAWGVLWGMLIFGEPFKWNMVPGALLVFFGIWLVVTADNA